MLQSRGSFQICLMVLLLLLGTVVSPFLEAKSNLQRIRFNTFTIEEGLSQSTVLSLAQDRLGYIWIGTQDGLNRFDGVNNIIFRHSPTDSKTINSPTIDHLLFDGDRTLWILTPQGLDSIDIHTLKITHWTNSLENLSLESSEPVQGGNEIWSIALNKDKSLSILSTNYFASIDIKNKSINRNQRLTDFIKGKGLQRMKVVDDRIFFINNNCILQVNFSGAQRKEFCSSELDEFKYIHTFEEYPENLFLTSTEGFSIFNIGDGSFQFHKIIDPHTESVTEVNSLIPAAEGGFWLATVNGLKYWDSDKQQVTKEYYSSFSDQYSIASDYTISLMRSRDGLLWLGTGLGVNFWDAREQFIHLLRKSEVSDLGRDNISTSLLRDYRDRLWIGTESSGVYQYNSNFSELKHFPSLPTDQGLQSVGYVGDMLEDDERNFWLLGSRGIFLKPYGSEYFYFLDELRDKQQKSISLADLSTIIESRNGDIWLGGEQGFFRLSISKALGEDIHPKHFELEDLSSYLPKSFIESKYGVYTMYEDLQGYLWLGSSKGLVRFSPLTLEIQYYLSEPNDPETLSSSDINIIYEDLLGVLWIGTVTGLNRVRYNMEGGVYFQRITVNDGFVNDFICSILSDRQGNLWLSTANGLVKFHPDKGRPVNYAYSDGLQYSEFFANAQYADEEGYLYFGGLNGVTYFNPEEIVIDKSHRPIIITDVEQQSIRFPLSRQGAELTYSSTVEAGLTTDIKFTVFDYLNAKNLEFRYKIDSLTSGWIELGNARQIRLHDIQDEKLTIRLQVRFKDGEWSNQETVLKLAVNKGFWRSNKGFMVYVLLLSMFVLGGGYYVYRGIKNKLRLKDRLLKEAESKNQLLLKDKKSLLYRVEDLQYSLSEQRYQVELLSSKLEQATMEDQLTGFRTRSYLKASIQQELDSILATWRGSSDIQGVYLGVFAVDVDNLAAINQQHGQLCGNEVIKQLAECLRTICYGTDTLVRWQGATLVVLSRGIEKREQMLLAEKIRNIVASRKFDLGNGTTTDVTCSIGFTRFPFTGNVDKSLTWEQIIYIVEKALGVAKKNSRNAWIGIFSNQFTRNSELDSKLASDLPALIMSGQLDYVSSIPKSKKLLWI